MGEIASLDQITKFAEKKSKDNYPYIEADEYFPNVYTLEMLAHTKSWRTDANIGMLADALNHINEIMRPENNIHVRICGKYVVPFFALVRPLRAFSPGLIDSITYRRLITEIAMLGVGIKAGVVRESADIVKNSIARDGILRMCLDKPHNRRYSPKNIEYPTPYADVRLETDRKKKNALECDLTFWAVQLLDLLGEAEW